MMEILHPTTYISCLYPHYLVQNYNGPDVTRSCLPGKSHSCHPQYASGFQDLTHQLDNIIYSLSSSVSSSHIALQSETYKLHS